MCLGIKMQGAIRRRAGCRRRRTRGGRRRRLSLPCRRQRRCRRRQVVVNSSVVQVLRCRQSLVVLGCLQASTAVFHANVGWSYLPPAGEEKHMGSVVERLTHTAFL